MSLPAVVSSFDHVTKKSKESTTSFVARAERFQSIGPLNIPDLEEFLVKAKHEFKELYKDDSVSDHQIGDFRLIKELGSGAFGRVVLAQIKEGDGSLYAIKVLDKKAIVKERQFQYVHNEKKILQSLNFPFVVYLKFFFVDFEHLYFAMPFVPGGDFFDYLHKRKPLTENHAKFYTCQLVLALEYLHFLGLIHRDLKPENIMLDALGYIKLVDFGQCTRCSAYEKAWTLTGTPEYMAPEIILALGYNFAVDWWALGVTVFEMCAGKRPFSHHDTAKLLKTITKGAFETPFSFSASLRSLVKSLLRISAAKRIGGKERGATEIKKHKWFYRTDWHAVLNRTLPAPFIPRNSLDTSKSKSALQTSELKSSK